MELKLPDDFLELLRKHAERKADLYDGVGKDQDVDFCLKLMAEELGEVNSALVRDRFIQAAYECIDSAHSAMLAYRAICKEIEGAN